MKKFIVMLAVVMASVFAVPPAQAAGVYHERHCKSVTVGLFDNNVVTMCVGTVHTLQPDGDGIRIHEEKQNFVEGCQFLVAGRKGSPDYWTWSSGSVTSKLDLGPLGKCTNYRFQGMTGPDRGPMDVKVDVKTQTNSGIGEEWFHFRFRLERKNDV